MTSREKALIAYSAATTISLLLYCAAGCVIARKALERWPAE